MAITSEAELETAITRWLGGRTDLTTYYPDWITLFEAHAARKLRVRLMNLNVTLTPVGGAATLPTDYLGWYEVIRLTSPTGPLEYIRDDRGNQLFPDYPTGIAQYFSIFGSTLFTYPQDDGDLQFSYYAKNTAISSTLNWLFNRYPDAYLWGALTEAHSFLADDGQLQIAKARRDEIMDEVQMLDFVEPGHLVMKSFGITP